MDNSSYESFLLLFDILSITVEAVVAPCDIARCRSLVDGDLDPIANDPVGPALEGPQAHLGAVRASRGRAAALQARVHLVHLAGAGRAEQADLVS